jgi:hypothetical protein
MVEIVKGQERNRPQPVCRITTEGRKSYLEYLTTLEQVIKDAASGTRSASTPGLVRGLAHSRV